MQGSKVCTKCQREVSLEGFRRDKRRADGRSSACKACYNAYDAEYRKKAGKPRAAKAAPQPLDCGES